MKKFLLSLLALVLTLCVVGLNACDKNEENPLEHEHNLLHHLAVEATCTMEGNVEYWSCTICGENFSDKNAENKATEIIVIGTHNLSYNPKIDYTCTTDGSKAHFACSECGKMFLDESGNNQITDIVIPKEHTGGTEIRDALASTTDSEGYTGDTYCLGCGDKIAEGETVNRLDHIHDMRKTNKIDENCTTDGNIEYYTCYICEKIYKDIDGIWEISLSETIIKASHDLTYNERISKTCTVNGTVAHYHCERCGKNFADDKGESELESIVIPAGHSLVAGECSMCGLRLVGTAGLEYALNDDGVSYSVIGLDTATGTDIIVPDVYNNFPVTAIGDGAFHLCTELESIMLSNSIKNIGARAFCECYSLQSIEIPNGLESIGDAAFYMCNLQSVIVPSTVQSIGLSTFYGCLSLQSITVDGNNEFYCSIDGNLYNKDKTELIQYAIGKTASSFTIPDSVQSIGAGAFEFCTSLQNVAIPDSIKIIGDYAFDTCTSLQSITIPKSVQSIGKNAFARCYGLTEIKYNVNINELPSDHYIFSDAGKNGEGIILTIGANVTKIPGNLFFYGNSAKITNLIFEGSSVCNTIGQKAFYNCTSLKSITIPDSIESIGDGAFFGCKGLTEIQFNGNVQDLQGGNGVFCHAGQEGTGITVTIGANVKRIPANLFFQSYGNIPKVAEVVFENNSTCESIGEYAFARCDLLQSVTIPDSVQNIGNYAFSECTSLQSVTIPDSVQNIGAGAFEFCEALQSVTIPEGVQNLGEDCFCMCVGLKSVVIPQGVKSLGNAFNNCKSLINITYKGAMAEWNNIDKGYAWDFNTGNYTIYCTDGNIPKS